MQQKILCPNCKQPLLLAYSLKYEVFQCKNCRLQTALQVGFDEGLASDLNEAVREDALKSLRLYNFRQIIPFIKDAFPAQNIEGIEIGCGYGWFLDECKAQNISCVGIEPETRFNDLYQKNGHSVRNGFYPNVLDKEEKYNFLIFNDVLEHIPEVNQVMKANAEHLKDTGLLVINIPIQNGLFHFISVVLYHLGIKSFLDRMWQFQFHSPHLYYFTQKNLKELAAKQGFEWIKTLPLKVINRSQIQSRIGQDKSVSKLKVFFLSFFIYLLSPLSTIMPDTYCLFFRKKEA